MPLSYGYIETLGLVAAIEAADAMLKAAKVNLLQKREIGFGLVTVIVEGELGAVQSAVDAGCKAAERIGQLISSNVIPRPYSNADFFFPISKKNVRSEQIKSDKIEQPVSLIKKEKTVKSQIKNKTKKLSADKQQMIINALKKSGKEGASLKEIAKIIKMEQTEARVILKELLDKNIIEKVQQKYYLL